MSRFHQKLVDQDLLCRLLGAYGLEAPDQAEPAGGTASPKWAVTTGGRRLLVRLRPPEFSGRESIRFDHASLGRLKEAGLPVPVPLAKADGATWLCLDGHVYEILRWVDGEPFDESNLEAAGAVGAVLARFHHALPGDACTGKRGKLREDHPDLLEPYVAPLRKLATAAEQRRRLDGVFRQLDYVRRRLDAGLYASLPHCVIHGDFHPGNVRFRGSEVAAIYDFDYLNVQARARDVCDGLMFFAATRETRLAPDDIRSLTQPFLLDSHRCRLLLRGYQDTGRLTGPEWRALPLLIRSRWIQMRLRGSRKVPEAEKATFVLDRFPEVIDWLDCKAGSFFDKLQAGL